VIGVVSALLLLASNVTAASADSDISTGLAYANAPGQGASLPAMAVTNNGPDPAAGVTLAGVVPGADNEGHPVDWQIFTNDAAVSEPFGPFAKIGSLSGPPYGVDPCTFTAGTEYRCDIGPLAVGETRTVVFNPTWEESNTAGTFTQWTGFSYTATLVGGTDPEPANNDNNSNFLSNGFYYTESVFGAGSTPELQVVEESPPASGSYAPGATVTLKITSTVPPGDVGGSVSVVVPDLESVSCSGDGVCLTGGSQAMTGPSNRVLVAMAGPPAPGSPWPAPPTSGGPYVFTTLVSAKLPASAPAGCAPGKTAPYTFDTTQQPVGGGSALVSTGIIKLPLTVQISCPEAPTEQPPSNPPGNPPATPPAISSTSAPPTARAVARHKSHAKKAQARPVRLKLTKVASRARVRAGQRLSYLIAVRNAGGSVAENVRVCDLMPAGLALVGSRPDGDLVKGRLCWKIKSLGAHRTRKFRVVVKALPGSSGRKVNLATAGAPHAKPVTATSAVRVIPLPPKPSPVTG
jgi:uncharacterized repeat protein (TIGR01451 family)